MKSSCHATTLLVLASVFLQIAAITAAFVLRGVLRKELLSLRQSSFVIVEDEKDNKEVSEWSNIDCKNSSSQMRDEMAQVESTTRKPCVLKLGPHGYIQGVTIFKNDAVAAAAMETSEQPSSVTPLAHYFGNVRYALPPFRRWAMARELPSDYSYGTKNHPGNCDGEAATCPQPDSDGAGWDEDCFQCNIWVPIDDGDRPADGWPVFFYIHGGFLQFGNANGQNCAALLSETDFKCVVVSPAYRLAVLGFLSSDELRQEAAVTGQPSGNQGFWDQRMALEWTYKHAHLFGGNASNITVAGYSAGAYSVFHQLAHDLYLPEEESVVRQAIMFSNGPGVQPKSALQSQQQFDELIDALHLPQNIPPTDKVAFLRTLPARTLIDASLRVKHHQYRPWNDGSFVTKSLFHDIDNGIFARRMMDRNVRLMNGECRDERFLYGDWHTPSNSLSALRQRIEADYPAEVCDGLVSLYYPHGQLPANCKNWEEAFGRLYADVQVHMMERGFMNALARNGAGHLLYRYRIEYRAKCVDHFLPPEWGVTHSSDLPMWLWGNGDRLEDAEKAFIRPALIAPLVAFVQGHKTIQWKTNGVTQARRLTSDGRVDVWDDVMWERGLEVWNAVRAAQSKPTAKL